MTQEELIEEIIQNLLAKNPMSFAELDRKIVCNRNNLKQAIDELILEGRILKKSGGKGKKIQLFLVQSDLRQHLAGIRRGLIVTESLLKKQMKVLKKHKYLFKFPVPVGKPIPHPSIKGAETIPPITWKINPRAKRDILFFTQCMNRLFEHSGSLTFAETTGQLPKSYNKDIKKYHKECLNLIKNSVSDLFRTHPEEKAIIQMYLFFSVRGLNTMTAMDQMSKRKF